MRTGVLKVSNILYSFSKPFTSTVAMAGADVVSDLREYYRMTEQIPTYLDLETLVNPANGQVLFSGGILVQPLPHPTPEESEKVIHRYKEHLKRLPPFSHLFTEEKLSLRKALDVLSIYPEDIIDDKIEKYVIDFYCRCSKKQFVDYVLGINEEAYQQLKQTFFDVEKPSFTCAYCNTNYYFEHDEIQDLEKLRERNLQKNE